MSCNKCPHHVRHGKVGEDGKSILFSDMCGLRMKQTQVTEIPNKKIKGRGKASVEPIKRKPLPEGVTMECVHYPFSSQFDYFHCKIYQETFESKGMKNGVVPTKDFQFSERLAGLAVTDMELL